MNGLLCFEIAAEEKMSLSAEAATRKQDQSGEGLRQLFAAQCFTSYLVNFPRSNHPLQPILIL